MPIAASDVTGKVVLVTGATSGIGLAALYLASPGAAFITGQTLVVDGGQTIRGLFPSNLIVSARGP